jgi:cytosine/creatinine deaminase
LCEFVTELHLHSARTVSGEIVDVWIDTTSGLITRVTSGEIHPADTATPSIDLEGYVLTTGFVEPHAHLDKAFLADRVDNPEGDLMGAIIGLDAIRSTITFEDIVNRATQAAIALSHNGVTAIRTHADVTLEGGLTPLLALLETKRRCAHFIDIQVAMLLEWPLTGEQGKLRQALALDAIAAGADIIGGCPHLDENPAQAVDILLQLAHDHNLPLDLHADENLRPTSHDLETLADMALRTSPTVPLNASHCVALSVHSDTDIERIADKVAQASISVTALPQTNLFLQSRDDRARKLRAITPIDVLRTHGVTVAAGADNVQDPFNPVGRLDPLETASLLVMAAHQSTHNAYDMVTSSAAAVFYGQPRTVEVGHIADLVAVPALNARQAIAMGPAQRIVIKHGKLLTSETYKL